VSELPCFPQLLPPVCRDDSRSPTVLSSVTGSGSGGRAALIAVHLVRWPSSLLSFTRKRTSLGRHFPNLACVGRLPHDTTLYKTKIGISSPKWTNSLTPTRPQLFLFSRNSAGHLRSISCLHVGRNQRSTSTYLWLCFLSLHLRPFPGPLILGFNNL
jgi:hypothetical protein